MLLLNLQQGKDLTLNKHQLDEGESSTWDFSGLKALFLNCTLKRSPEVSHTEGLIDISRAIMEKNGVSVEVLRPVDFKIAHGVYPDMTEQGWAKDEWPVIYEKIKKSEFHLPYFNCIKSTYGRVRKH